MPNPWDVGSALALEQMGFRAMATTSAGFAWTLGRADRGVGLEETLEHLRAVVDAVSLPVSADFEGGYAVDPEQVSTNVKRAVATGIAGLSIEDSTGDEADPLVARPGGRTGARGASSDRRNRDGRCAHRPLGRVRSRPP